VLVVCDEGAVVTGEHFERLCDALPLDLPVELPDEVPDLEGLLAGCRTVEHRGVAVAVDRELVFELRLALQMNEQVPLSDTGPTVDLALDDHTLLRWLRRRGGPVLVLDGDPGPDPRVPVP
jgi:hypothetical protein